MYNLPTTASTSQSMANIPSYKAELARELSQQMAIVQKNELLTADILSKISELSTLEMQILEKNPHAKERMDFTIKSFVLSATKYL
ncbi:hypothetical protein MKL26_02895 [Streptococcus suis]|nr:hypothetical protein [Streptococcus suis]